MEKNVVLDQGAIVVEDYGPAPREGPLNPTLQVNLAIASLINPEAGPKIGYYLQIAWGRNPTLYYGCRIVLYIKAEKSYRVIYELDEGGSWEYLKRLTMRRKWHVFHDPFPPVPFRTPQSSYSRNQRAVLPYWKYYSFFACRNSHREAVLHCFG